MHGVQGSSRVLDRVVIPGQDIAGIKPKLLIFGIMAWL